MLFPPQSDTTGANPTCMQVGLVEQQDFRPSPLEPTWILEGNPEAQSCPLTSSADGRFTSGRWSCTGGRFKFIYACDEIVHILEGSVTVEESGRVRTLRPGDVAYFPQGLESVWTVHGYVKKFAIFRVQPGRLINRVAKRALRSLKKIAALASLG